MTGATELIHWLGKRYLYLSLVCFSIPLLCYALQYSLGYGFGPLKYMATTYAVNYVDYGFTRRGLIGTLLWWLPLKDYGVIALASSVICFLIFLSLFDRAVRHITDTLTRNLLKIAFAISPFTAFQFAYEIGRLDLLNIIILVIALYLVHKRQWGSVLLLTIAGMLIHEAFAFFCAPLIMASLWLAKDDSTSDQWLSKKIYIGIYSGTVAITSLLIVKFGNNPLVLTLSPGVGQEAWNRPLVQHALTRLSPIDLMLTAMVVSYSYIWLVSFYRSNNGRLDAWFIAACAPLMLFVVGWDYARWSGLIFVVVLIVIAFKAITEGWSLSLRNMRFGAAFLLLPLGPIGSEQIYPILRSSAAIFHAVRTLW